MDFPDISASIAEVANNYRYRETPAILLFIQDLVAKIKRFIADLLSMLHLQLPGFSANTKMVGNAMELVLLGAGVLAIALLVFLVWRRMGHLNAQALRARRGSSDSEVPLDSKGWRDQAEELARAQQYKLACRAVYLSLMKRLDEKSILEFVPTRTNYEYWYALSRHRPIALLFRELANVVESSWFGNRTATNTDFETCIRLLADAEREIDADSAAAAAVAAAEKAAV